LLLQPLGLFGLMTGKFAGIAARSPPGRHHSLPRPSSHYSLRSPRWTTQLLQLLYICAFF
jgi:hypothetical protein